MDKVKKIAVLTSGGDAPGMNAAIRAVVRRGLHHGLDVMGFSHGYEGLLKSNFMPLSRSSVSGIIGHGGTILKTARSEAFVSPGGFQVAVKNLRDYEIDALIVIGGNGSMAGAIKLSEAGIPTMTIPATIDNDMFGTDYAIGFDTALNTVVDAVNKIRDTAASHERVALVQVMGRSSGHIAMMSGLAAGAEVVIIPEQPWTIEELCNQLNESYARGRLYSLVMLAEGVGNGFTLADEISSRTGFKPHVTVLGYIQRGGSPSAKDNIMATRMGSMAVDALVDGRINMMAAELNGEIKMIPYEQAINDERGIDLSIYDLIRSLAK